ncbi:MAG: DNA polymerase III subunit gamma/tau [Gammaproteobacteria bacterium]|nr:DNA polymerase III subunit gamma/tau [Gammaproteobacteria bacterium]
MKYQVLARKYRPKTFTTMMGQEHVLKALSNALQSGRLHHAYLFTGTRGVGKTTVARVLAKALNCEQGISASPCGECAACQEIDQGRFVDLIEVDAASRTKVEDTRELLDNVQYAPTRGRFKIYLIDEVHMLSGHSFNALLKTLEEPPPHVKFLLATTDPQKLPVTILSRCLQFNLKSLTIEQIEQQLHLILNAENIPFEDNVLKPLAVAADGSMRDALSLLDQSIAYSDGKPNLADIEAMLGSVQKDRIFELLTALADEDGRFLIEQSRLLTAQGIDVNTILAELISTLQRIALCQMVPDAVDDSLGDKPAVEKIAQHISPEDIQLYYQIALNGRKDLPYSPQPQGGFEMILLRMLAFKPAAGDGRRQTVQTVTQEKAQNVTNSQQNSELTEKKTAETLSEPTNSKLSNNQGDSYTTLQKKNASPDNSFENNLSDVNSNQVDYDLPPVDAYGQENFSEPSNLPSFDTAAHITNKEAIVKNEQPLADVVPLFKADIQDKIPCNEQESNELADYWHDLINRSELNGLEQQLAKHCALVKKTVLASKTQQNSDQFFELLLDSVHKHLLSDKITTRLINNLEDLLGCTVKVDIKECQVRAEKQLNTPRRREIHDAEVLQQQAEESIYSDPKVQMIVNAFAAEIHKESIKPV